MERERKTPCRRMESWLPESLRPSIFCSRTASFKGGGLKNCHNGKGRSFSVDRGEQSG